ncbi:RagB/SusD family nutrient uptake outer membrane protein [Dyadobacter bucti]|uniref:RagB/SusD family nutrient uptake outer membrane protein n=1 Tax=Dyadobacter bucti TaxID=2572203 RepID=UPI00110841CA|nr:RagB/SusD family nutrient uptake outer membrane protein [Dyadobacter bucti]
MKKYNFLSLLVAGMLLQGCSDFLDKEPLGRETDTNYFSDSTNTLLAINAAYDVASYDEGNDGLGNYLPHNYEWMFGDVLSDDAEKGSTASDFIDIQHLKEWRALPVNGPVSGVWGNLWIGVYRSNWVLKNIETAPISETLKSRIKGEAHFLRAYYYFYLVRLFGGMPLFSEPVKTSEYAATTRSTLAETYAFIEADLQQAITLLPEKNQYAAPDLGRATKGAARGYLARAIMYQLGMDNTNNHTWQQVYDLTEAITQSGQYGLTANYAAIFDEISENNTESLFEIQAKESGQTWGPIKTGTTNNVIQNNRATWGWGFNNPTTDLADEFEANDPRKAMTIYGNGYILFGVRQTVNFPDENMTGYLNRKTAIVQPAQASASGQNIRKMRYAEILLMKAEAAARSGNEAEARTALNMVRQRAKRSTLPKGSKEGTATYDPTNIPATALPDVSATVTGTALVQAILHERRVELGMEHLRFWDQVRNGTYMNSLSGEIKTRAQQHSVAGSVNPVPVLPIPLNEVQTWGLQQNPGY